MQTFWLVEIQNPIGAHSVVGIKDDGFIGVASGDLSWRHGIRFCRREDADAFVRLCERMHPKHDFFTEEHRVGEEAAPLEDL